MTFQEWWGKEAEKDFSKYAIPEEIEWFAEQAWNAAVCVMMDQERKNESK